MRSSQKWVRSVTIKSIEKVLKTGLTGLTRLTGLTGLIGLTGLTGTDTRLLKSESVSYSLSLPDPILEMLAHLKRDVKRAAIG